MRTLLSALAVACIAALIPACSASVDDPAADSTDALGGSYPVGTKLETTADVNLRAKPSPNSTILDVIPDGTIVASAAAKPVAGWYGVTSGGKTGWVLGAYLRVPTGGATHFSRQVVYDAIKNRKTCSGGAASDVLDSSLTTQSLVDAIGWIAARANFSWGFCVINTGHHYDPAAHSSGYAIDFFANASADDVAMMKLVNQDPYFVEIGVSGDYVATRYLLTSSGKCSFVENAPTHIHASVKRAFC